MFLASPQIPRVKLLCLSPDLQSDLEFQFNEVLQDFLETVLDYYFTKSNEFSSDSFTRAYFRINLSFKN